MKNLKSFKSVKIMKKCMTIEDILYISNNKIVYLHQPYLSHLDKLLYLDIAQGAIALLLTESSITKCILVSFKIYLIDVITSSYNF